MNKSKLWIILIVLVIFCTYSCTVDNGVEKNNFVDDKVQVASLKGPTTMGLVKLMRDEEEKENSTFEFQIATMVDEIITGITTGKLDIAAIPANVASVLYNKTGGKIKVAAINTLGVLYIVENGNSISDISDLKDKVVYTTGRGSSPEHVINYVLIQNNLVPGEDVTIEYKSEPAEISSILATKDDVIAMIPEPFLTSAKMKNQNIKTVLDMTEEWNKIDNAGGSSLVTGVLVVREEFLRENEDLFDEFLSRYEDSVEYVNRNVADAAKLIHEYGIVSEQVAKDSIPNCNITYVDGEELKLRLNGYLETLYKANPESIGGTLPDEGFYYEK